MSSVSVSLAVTLFVLNKEARCQGKISSKASDTQAADEGMQRMFGNQVIYFCFSSKLAVTYGVKTACSYMLKVLSKHLLFSG